MFNLIQDTLLNHAFYHAPIGMSLVSLDGKWIKVNPALCEITGYTDGLTGIANRRWFDAALESEWARGLRNSTPLSLIILDIGKKQSERLCVNHDFSVRSDFYPISF